MELIVALGVGLLCAAGVYLLLRPRLFSVVLGLSLLSYGVNVLIFLGGRVDRIAAPIAKGNLSNLADPLPQALVLTAIVIGFGMTAYLIAMALRAVKETGTDHVDGHEPGEGPPA